MLKFFRRIRQKLIGKGNLKRYSIYAIGEILLVMIGILLAVQVNSWNENKKRNKIEVQILSQIQEECELDITTLESMSDEILQDVSKIKSLLSHLRAKESYTDSLEELFYYPFRGYFFSVNNSAYIQLSNRGVDIISNETLRNKIVIHYEVEMSRFKMIAESEAFLRNNFRIYYQTKTAQRPDEFFVGHTGREYVKTYPLDYDSIVSDIQFRNQLLWRIGRKKQMANRLRDNLVKQKEKLKGEIEQELEKIK